MAEGSNPLSQPYITLPMEDITPKTTDDHSNIDALANVLSGHQGNAERLKELRKYFRRRLRKEGYLNPNTASRLNATTYRYCGDLSEILQDSKGEFRVIGRKGEKITQAGVIPFKEHQLSLLPRKTLKLAKRAINRWIQQKNVKVTPKRVTFNNYSHIYDSGSINMQYSHYYRQTILPEYYINVPDAIRYDWLEEKYQQYKDRFVGTVAQNHLLISLLTRLPHKHIQYT